MTLEVRDRRFALDRDAPPPSWHPAGPAVTAFFDNLSLFFPPGERFFVASVKPYRERINDPALAAEVKAFCAQEAIHAREHVGYNRMLAAGGLDAEAMESRVTRILRRVTRITPRRWRLAVTCALEHYTATMGHILLSDERILEGADPQMAALWRWHAAEETEHRSVAFDVYRVAGGNYVERVALMAAATLIFWLKVAEHQVRIMRARKILFSPRAWRRLLRWTWVRPGWGFKLLAMGARYLRPGFHPSELESSQLLEQWKVTG